MSHNQPISIFRRSHRRKQIDNLIIEQDNHIQSIGDTPIIHDIFEQILIQPSIIINHNDYIYMIYLLVLIIFYIYYIIIILQEKTNLFDDYYFDNYEREIPRLLWFKKGYRLH
jgi:hypothetical protein